MARWLTRRWSSAAASRAMTRSPGRRSSPGSCAALATGCATAVDPLTVYRQALERVAATAAAPVTFAGRTAYRFTLPVQALRDGVRIAQVVTVDARTLLPERIEWREQRPGGRSQTAAVIDIRDIGAVARDQAPLDAFALTLPRRTRVTQLAGARPAGAPGRHPAADPARSAGIDPGARLARPARAAATRSARSGSTATTQAWRCGCATARFGYGTTGRSCRRRCWKPARAGEADRDRLSVSAALLHRWRRARGRDRSSRRHDRADRADLHQTCLLRRDRAPAAAAAPVSGRARASPGSG